MLHRSITGRGVKARVDGHTVLIGNTRLFEERNIRQNLLFGLLLSPLIAAAAMSLSAISVIGNALRLRRTRL